MAAVPKIDILVLSSVARIPMHGYEIKLELQYKHVRWWAKCEHGHLYASLKRLEASKLIRGKTRSDGARKRRVFSITPAGRAFLADALADLARSPDSAYFDVDLFLSGTFSMPKQRALQLLADYGEAAAAQRAEAQELLAAMGDNVPTVGKLIMEHRIDHLAREEAFAERAAATLAAEKRWGSFLGDESIGDFLARTRAAIEG